MYRILMTTIVLLTVRLYAQGQERVTPRVSKGGEKQGEPWAEVPESFRNVKIPERPLPTDLERWQKVDHAKIRATLPKCLGEMPVRPDPSKVRAVSKADRGDYFQERFEFDNGVDMTVPGLLLIPKNRKGPAPAVIVLHGTAARFGPAGKPSPRSRATPGESTAWHLARMGNGSPRRALKRCSSSPAHCLPASSSSP